MRLQNLYFVGALAAAAIPLSAGAQRLPANDRSTTNSQTVSQANRRCPPGWVWEPAGYLGSGKWRPARCASRGRTIDF
jgi:hypothetical protein